MIPSKLIVDQKNRNDNYKARNSLKSVNERIRRCFKSVS